MAEKQLWAVIQFSTFGGHTYIRNFSGWHIETPRAAQHAPNAVYSAVTSNFVFFTKIGAIQGLLCVSSRKITQPHFARFVQRCSVWGISIFF